MTQLLIPNEHIENITNPLIFLAGPIRSGPNWHDEAVLYLASKDENLTIVSPRRFVRDPIAPYIVKSNSEYFPRQRAWERHYLDYASRKGCIMFWLAGETEHDCNKSYGAMTRVELGQWMTRYSIDNSIKFCVGGDGKFSEENTIAFDLSIDAPDKKIFRTLEETCDEALRLARTDM